MCIRDSSGGGGRRRIGTVRIVSIIDGVRLDNARNHAGQRLCIEAVLVGVDLGYLVGGTLGKAQDNDGIVVVEGQRCV